MPAILAIARGRRGFTLFELMIAIVLTGIVAAMGYAAFGTLIDRREAVRQAMVETERAAALRRVLEDWIGRGSFNLQPTAAPTADITRPDHDVVQLSVRTRIPAMGFQTALQLAIDDDPATPERGLTLRYMAVDGRVRNGVFARLATYKKSAVSSAVADANLPSIYVRELDPNITGLRVELLDHVTRRWYTPQQLAAGAAIAIRVTLIGPRTAPLAPLLQVPIVRVLATPEVS